MEKGGGAGGRNVTPKLYTNIKMDLRPKCENKNDKASRRKQKIIFMP